MGRPKGIIRRLADDAGLDQATVRRALAASDITEAQAEADFDNAVEAVTAIADTAKVIGHAASGRGEGSSNAYAEARAQAELHRARKLELQNAKLEGSLVDRDAVTATGARIIAEVRTALLALGHRVASKAMGKTDAREIARIVEAEVRDVLGVLADEEKFFAALQAEALS
ncbi:hypothetical protein OZ411_28730 [Bradyrhizobium sp. Arg237L]|uniref:hypothetical protein n=1 Tax=Bradyrhizobium sp. Arg237L TaxID=3003352 RepID=UPI00249EBCE6|nr:hypothetical protein [Bradyrhizobium sp. Arg237L]MDI4236803.1 hypothetical protein [Bradyrhizobium sp. Arg237L]